MRDGPGPMSFSMVQDQFLAMAKDRVPPSQLEKKDVFSVECPCGEVTPGQTIDEYVQDHEAMLCVRVGVTTQELAQRKEMLKAALSAAPQGVEAVARADRLVTDFLSQGHPFMGFPALRMNPRAGLELHWSSSESGLTRIGSGPFYCADSRVLEAIVQLFASDGSEALKQLFDLLKNSAPHGYVESGCNERCLWLTCALECAFGVDCYKIKVWSPDGERFLKADPSLFPKDVRWLMHTAPVVRMDDGSEYVFDLSLDAPTPLHLWKENLIGEAAAVVTVQDQWDIPCGQAVGEMGEREKFSRVIEDLRGLYLYEVIDGNARDKKWTDWVVGERGFAPVAGDIRPLKREETQVEVVIRVSRSEDGHIWVKTKKLPFLTSFVQHGDQYFTEATMLKYRELSVAS